MFPHLVIGSSFMQGTTTYYSSNCDLQDAEVTQEFLIEKDLSAYNTRLFKMKGSGKVEYEVRLASAECSGKRRCDTL